MGMLTIGGSLSLANGSVFDYQFGTPGANFATPGQSDSVSVGGNLLIAGNTTINVTDTGGFGPGVYRLVDYGGALTGGGTLTLGGVPGGATVVLQNLSADKRFTLVNSTGMTLDFWNANGLASPTQSGGGTGTWSTTSPVWTDAVGNISLPMQPQPGFAIFTGAPGTVTVDNTGGAVQATGLQFASNGYTLTGDALTLLGAGGGAKAEIRVGDGGAGSAGFTATLNNTVAGTAGIAKTGDGTLVLGGTNTYTGGTAVQGGTLSVSADVNLGAAAGNVTLDGGRLQVTGTAFTGTARNLDIGAAGGGIEIVDPGLDFTASGALGGSGGLVKSGAGTLTLAGTSTLTGATTVAAEEQLANIGRFFDIIRTQSALLADDRAVFLARHLSTLIEAGDDPPTADPDPDVDAVHVMTVHKAKGLEFPVVFLPGLVVDRFPARSRREPLPMPIELVDEVLPEGDGHLQEERRLFYVAMTRARDELVLSHAAESPSGRGRRVSQFVIEALDLPTAGFRGESFPSTTHASSGYLRSLTGTLVRRAIERAR